MRSVRWAPIGAVLLGCASGAPSGAASDGPAPIGEEAITEITAPSSPEGFHYPTFSDQPFVYQRFDSLVTIHPGGATQIQTFGRTAYLRVSVSDSTVLPELDSLQVPVDSLTPIDSQPPAPRTQLLVRVRLDSINQDPNSSLRQPALDSVQGASWSVLMDPTGGVGIVTDRHGSSVGETLSGELARLMFPPLPSTGADIGAEWRDSTENRIGGLSVSQTERAITSFMVPDQELEAVTALRIDGEAQLERWGKEEQGGRVIELEGTGVDSTSWFLGAGGRFLGAEGRDSVSLMFTIPAVGQSVPVVQLGRYRLQARDDTPEDAAP